MQPKLQPPGHGIVTGLGMGDVAGEMREAGLMSGGVSLLGSVALREPHRGPCPSIIARTTTARRVGEAVCTTASAERKTEWKEFEPSIRAPVSSEATTAAQRRHSRRATGLEAPL